MTVRLLNIAIIFVDNGIYSVRGDGMLAMVYVDP